MRVGNFSPPCPWRDRRKHQSSNPGHKLVQCVPDSAAYVRVSYNEPRIAGLSRFLYSSTSSSENERKHFQMFSCLSTSTKWLLHWRFPFLHYPDILRSAWTDPESHVMRERQQTSSIEIPQLNEIIQKYMWLGTSVSRVSRCSLQRAEIVLRSLLSYAQIFCVAVFCSVLSIRACRDPTGIRS